MRKRSVFAGFEDGGREQLLEDGKGKEITLPWSFQKSSILQGCKIINLCCLLPNLW